MVKMHSFEAVTEDYRPVSSGWTTRKGAVRSCVAHGAARVIQGGYDENNGERFFREVYPRIRRTWQPRFQPMEAR